MAIKAGQLLWSAGGTPGYNFIIDRLQSADVRPNVPKESVMELGNQYTVGVVRDTPDLSFDCESFDMTAKLEAMILGGGYGWVTSVPSYFSNLDPASLSAGQQLDFNAQVPLNILAPFRSSQVIDTITQGCIVPNLALASFSYRLAVRQNAQMTATFRGDSIFYTPGLPYEDVMIWDGTATGGISDYTMQPYINVAVDGLTQHVLNMVYYNPDGTYGRLFNGADFDFTDTSTTWTFSASVTITAGIAYFTNGNVMQTGALIVWDYSSTNSYSIPQSDNTADGTTVKPAAVRSYDIQVYFGSQASTPVWTQVSGVQGVDLTWTASGMEQNWEFGNALASSIDYVVPAVTGTVTVRPNTVTQLLNLLDTTADVAASHVIGALSSAPLPMAVVFRSPGPDPAAGTAIKSLYTADAHFDPPDLSMRVNQKLDMPFAMQSDTGSFFTYNGLMPGLPTS